MCVPDWLPELILFEDYGGDWTSYCESLHNEYVDGFHGLEMEFLDKRVALKKHPITNGKDCTFWHFIQQGSVEDDRTPDLRRCERIRWPLTIIQNYQSDDVKAWRGKRRGKSRIYLLVESAKYIVVLDERAEYVLPWTAYYIEYDNSLRRLLKEYDDSSEKIEC